MRAYALREREKLTAVEPSAELLDVLEEPQAAIATAQLRATNPMARRRVDALRALEATLVVVLNRV
jgi:hypothetical protein